jgi:hypothetical protein
MTTPNPLRGYLETQREFDIRITRLLNRVAVSLSQRIERLASSGRFSDSVRASQLRAVLLEVRREQIRVFRDMGDVIRAGQIAAALMAAEQLGQVTKVITASLSARAAEELISSVQTTARAGIKNLYARTSRELSSRLYDQAAWSTGKIEELIQNGIASGLSARELARDVRSFVSPSAPGGTSFVSMRLARTEINNAFHNQQIAGMDAPGVTGAKWNLSGSHPRPDECNRLAQSDQYNMGVGVFPRGKVPGKPHPQCLCYLTYVMLTPKQFVEELRKGAFDDDLRKRYKANLDLIKGGVEVPKSKLTVVKKTTTTPKKAEPKKTTTPKKATVKKTTAPKKTAPVVKVVSPKEVPVPRGAQPYHTSLKGIEDLAETVEKSAIKSVQRLTGGVSADTELVTFANGTKLVRKSAGNPGAEQASSVIGGALRTKAPRVYRNHPGEVWMDYVEDAKTAVELQVRANQAGKLGELRKEHFALAQSDEGLRVGLFDLAIRNGDRNTGNWMVSNAGRIVPIDHGHAQPVIIGGRAMPQLSASGPFAEQIFVGSGKEHVFTTADIDWARHQIEGVGPDLIHMGQKGFLDYALAVLDRLRPFSKGTRNILAGE